MKTEFCHLCQEPIEEFDFFWWYPIEEIGPLLQRIPKMAKICTHPLCSGENLYYMSLENKRLWKLTFKMKDVE